MASDLGQTDPARVGQTERRVFKSADPWVKFAVTLPTGEIVDVWARTQEHAEQFAAWKDASLRGRSAT